MGCDKCGVGRGLCPVTLGLALGITCALMVFICSAWAMTFGLPVGMEEQMRMSVAHTWGEAGIRMVYALLKGFVGGFVFAMIYDLILCCKSKCCGKCSCCTPKN